MTTSKCFVWIWLPGATEPVVAGERRADARGQETFVYGRSFLNRSDAVPIYTPELPLRPGIQEPANGLYHFACLRDAAPDAWGRRVILSRFIGNGLIDTAAEVPEELFLLHSGSDRIGALDFQRSATLYEPRDFDSASLDDLCRSAELLATGKSIPPDLDAALFHGSSIGGARPKAAVTGPGAKYVAKFSVSTDTFNIVKAEWLAMTLAARAGLDVAHVSLTTAAGRDVLLVERFDRISAGDRWHRRALISGLTALGLDERWAREASYPDLARKFHQIG